MTNWIDIPRTSPVIEPVYNTYNLGRKKKTSDSLAFKIPFYIDETFAALTASPLKVELFEHQKRVIPAMLDMEDKRYLMVDGEKLHTTSCIISDKPGSGKTLLILGVISKSKSPRPRTEFGVICTRTAGMFSYNRRYGLMCDTNLVFVSSTVMESWISEIGVKSKLKVLSINGIREIRKFILMTHDRQGFPSKAKLALTAAKYDIILIKNGPATANVHSFTNKEFEKYDMLGGGFDAKVFKDNVGKRWESNGSGSSSSNTVTIMSAVFRDVCFGRCWLDDFDILSIPRETVSIPATFTWFVSATRVKQPNSTPSSIETPSTDISRIFSRPTYMDLWNNPKFVGLYNIATDPKYIDVSISAPITTYLSYVIESNNAVVDAIDALAGNEYKQMMEMIHADAPINAARAIGAKTNDVAGIIQKLLDGRYERYCKSVKSLQFIQSALESLSTYEPTGSYSFTKADQGAVITIIARTFNQQDLSNICSKLNEEGFTDIVKFLKTNEEPVRKELVDMESMITRARDKLREGTCPISTEPFGDQDNVYITNCCGVSISESGMDVLRKMINNTGNNNKIEHQLLNCFNCQNSTSLKSFVKFHNSLVERLTNDSNNAEVAMPGVKFEEVRIVAPLATGANDGEGVGGADSINNLSDTMAELGIDLDDVDILSTLEETMPEPEGKMLALYQILTEQKVTGAQINTHVKPLINGLIQGVRDMGHVGEKRVLVFASHVETIKKICTMMIYKKVSYQRLRGTAAEMAVSVDRYKLPNSDVRHVKLLLVNGSRNCAGINLQNTTDVIIMHDIVDPSLLTQIGGRAARPGRTSNLKFHFVLNTAEYERLLTRL